MKYELEIQGVLGIEQAFVRLVAGEVTEVIGPNASGKTSVAVAAQAVLARDINPLGLPATDAKKHYAHDGDGDNAEAEVAVYGELMTETVESDGVTAEVQMREHLGDIVWRPAAQTVTGPPDLFPSTPEAVGLIDFRARKSARERAEALQSALLPPPHEVMERVESELKRYLTSKELAGVMTTLRERGWDKTEAVYAERGRVAKREWQDIAGKNWGARIAADWRPEGWHADWDHLTVTETEARVVDARDELAVLHREVAITEAQLAAANRAAADLPAAEVARDEAMDARDEAAGTYDAALTASVQAKATVQSRTRDLNEARAVTERAAATAARLETDTGVSCPHCEGRLLLNVGTVRPFDTESHEALLAEAREALAVAETAEAEARERQEAAATAHDEADAEAIRVAEPTNAAGRAFDRAKATADALAESAAVTGKVRTADDEAALAAAEQAVEDAKAVVAAVSAHSRATALQETITKYSRVAHLLGSQGVRAQLLEAGLGRLNAGLEWLSALTEWPKMTVATNGSVMWAGRPVQMCSESEQWRAQACIQLTLAAITESAVVILDRADLLDGDNQRKLAGVLDRVADRTGVAVLVCATAEQPQGDGALVLSAGREAETS